MAIVVGNATPGKISGVATATPGSITGVGNAQSGNVSGVVPNYGFQTSPYIGAPTSIRVGNAPPITPQVASNQQGIDTATAQFNAIKQQLAALAPKPQVYAPKIDFAAVNAQARQSAESAVNPYYTKQLNDFLAQQSALKQREQEQYDTSVQNYDDTLKQIQEANALTGARTTEDVALNQQQIAADQNQNQIDTGNAFEQQRLAEARKQAVAGVLGTGAGNRDSGNITAARNTTEAQQNQKFQEAKNAQELFKGRTFEDLAKSTTQAGVAKDKSVKQAKFNLDAYIQNAGFTEANTRNSLEQERLGRVSQETNNQGKLLINNFINNIADPAQRQAAINAYGGAY